MSAPFETALTAEESLARCLQRRPLPGHASEMLRELRERYGFALVPAKVAEAVIAAWDAKHIEVVALPGLAAMDALRSLTEPQP